MSSIVTKPSLIEYGPLKFLVMDAPKETNLHFNLISKSKFNILHLNLTLSDYKDCFQTSKDFIRVSIYFLFSKPSSEN